MQAKVTLTLERDTEEEIIADLDEIWDHMVDLGSLEDWIDEVKP